MDPTIVSVPIKSLRFAEYNPRTISKKALAGLASSLARFGYVEPIVWNKRSGNIVGGHQRAKILSDQGVSSVKVVAVDLSDDDERALNVTLNNPNVGGEFTDGLQDLLSKIKSKDAEVFKDLRLDELATKRSSNGEVPEIQFSEIIGERQDYIVLAFRSEVDFVAALTVLEIPSVHDRRSTGKPWSKGLGRVVDGAKVIERFIHNKR